MSTKSKYSEVTQYIAWLFKQSREYPLKIIGDTVSSAGDTIFTIQFLGKNVCPKVRAKELAKDDQILNNLSPLDVKQVMQAAVINNDTHRVTAKSFMSQGGDTLFTIEGRNNLVKKLTSTEIARNKALINGLVKDDVFEVGYAAGCSSISQELSSIKKALNATTSV